MVNKTDTIDTPEWIPDSLELWVWAKATEYLPNDGLWARLKKSLPNEGVLARLKKSLPNEGILAGVVRKRSNEGSLYRDLDRLEAVLGNGSSVEEFRVCRDHDIPKAYQVYTNEIETRFRPYFHGRITRLKIEFNERIKQLEKRQDLQEGYVGSN